MHKHWKKESWEGWGDDRRKGKKDTGTEIKYYTKGDANSEIDEGYRVEDDIIGKIKAKIPYIGEATLMLNEIFK